MGYGKIKMKPGGLKSKKSEKKVDMRKVKEDANKFMKTMRYKYGNFKMSYSVGGMKPDYLDFDKDGDKKESMKSALASRRSGKKEMKKGGKKMMMGGTKKKMGGGYKMKK